MSGTISVDTTWSATDSPYLVSGDVTVPTGVVLTVDPGVVVKFEANAALSFGGELSAVGTASDPIVFTSAKDDSFGGDSNGDGGGSSPGRGDWGLVRTLGGSSALEVAHAVVRYGGAGQGYCWTSGVLSSYLPGTLDVSESVFEHNLNAGVGGDGASVSKSTFRDSGCGVSLGSGSEYVGNVFEGSLGYSGFAIGGTTGTKFQHNVVRSKFKNETSVATGADGYVAGLDIRFNEILVRPHGGGLFKYNWWGRPLGSKPDRVCLTDDEHYSTFFPADTAGLTRRRPECPSYWGWLTNGWAGDPLPDWSGAPPVATADGEVRAGFRGVGSVGTELVGDPVDVATGNATDVYTDLVGSEGISGLGWVRSWNSLSDAGVLGMGYSTLLDMGVAPGAGAGAPAWWVQGPSGRMFAFEADGSGGFVRPAEFDGDLTVDGSGAGTIGFDDGSEWVFDADGRIVSLTDADGVATAVARDSNGRATKLVSSLGPEMTFGWTDTGRVESVTADDSRTVTYAYDPRGNLSGVTGPDNKTTVLENDTAGRLVKVVDPTGVETLTNTYDAEGRVVSQTEAGTAATTFVYAAAFTTVTSGGESVTFDKDVGGRVVGVTDTNAESVSKTFDGRGNQTGGTDRLGGNSSVTVDGSDLPTKVVSPGLGDVDATWTSGDRPASVTGPDGKVTTFTYSGSGKVPATVMSPGGGVTTMVSSGGLVSKVTDPDGVETDVVFDSYRRPVSFTDGEGGVSTVAYDSAGRPTVETDAEGGVFTTVYDDVGRVVSVTDAEGAVTTTGFDDAGRPLTVTDPEGGVATFVYDSQGRLSTETGPEGGVTTTTYSSNGDVASVTDPEGGVTAYTYGPMGRVATVTDPEGGVTTFGYDDDGNITTVTDPEGGVTTSVLDAAGRPTSVTDPDGRVTATTYDTAGRPTSITEPGGRVTTTAYDDDGNIVSVTDPGGGVTAYTYTDAGRVATVTDPEGRATTNTYDNAGRLVTVTGPDSTVETRSYDDAGRVVSIADPQGGTSTIAYDDTGRPTVVTDPHGVAETTVYDDSGRPTGITRTGEGTRTFAYDDADRLISAVDPLGDQTTFAYDDNGARTSRTGPDGTVESWTYDDNGQIVTNVTPWGGTRTYTYAKNGLPTTVGDPTDGPTTYDWTPGGQLNSKTAPGSIVESYTYNTAGDRTGVTNPDGTWTYTFDPMGHLTGETGPSGRTQTYEWDHTGLMTSHRSADGTKRTWAYDSAGRPTGVSADAMVADRFDVPDGWAVDPQRWDANVTGGASLETGDGELVFDLPAGAAGVLGARGPPTADVEFAGRYEGPTPVEVRLREDTTSGAYVAVRPSGTSGTAELIETDGTTLNTLGTLTMPTDGNLRVVAENTTIKAKAWSGSEPAGWDLTATTTQTAAGETSVRATNPGATVSESRLDDVTIAPTGSLASLASWSYDTSGRPSTVTTGTTTRTFGWDVDRPTSETVTDGPTTVSTIGRTYDTTGRLGTTTDSNDGTTTYAYDQASQLVGADGPGARDFAYTYNSGGRRATETGPAGTTTYSYATGGLLDETSTSAGTVPYVWDNTGRLTSKGSGPNKTSYTWNADSRLTSIVTPDSTTIRKFNPDGLETSSVNTPTGGTGVGSVTDWTPEQIPQPVLTQTDGHASVERVDGPTGLVAFRNPTGTITPTLLDPAGSPTSPTGTSAAGSYGPFGAPSGTPINTAPTVTGYRGERTINPDDGPLVDLRNRVYDPTIGMFLTPDPVDSTPGTTTPTFTHHYTHNNPTNLYDPAGLFGLPVPGFVKDAGRAVLDRAQNTAAYKGARATYQTVKTEATQKWRTAKAAASAAYQQAKQWGADKIRSLKKMEARFRAAIADPAGLLTGLAVGFGCGALLAGTVAAAPTVVGSIALGTAAGMVCGVAAGSTQRFTTTGLKTGDAGQAWGAATDSDAVERDAIFGGATGGLGSGIGAARAGKPLLANGTESAGRSTTTVTSWASEGKTPDFKPGRWVMKGGHTKINYGRSGLWGPQFDPFRWRGAPFKNALTEEIPTTSLKWPTGWERIKGLLGQRIIR